VQRTREAAKQRSTRLPTGVVRRDAEVNDDRYARDAGADRVEAQRRGCPADIQPGLILRSNPYGDDLCARLDLVMNRRTTVAGVIAPACLRDEALANPGAPSAGTRTVRDLLGNKTVPDTAYDGVHTARAVENPFGCSQSGSRMPPGEVRTSREADRVANGGWHGESSEQLKELLDPAKLANLDRSK
jgi:hypothetical protein